jgi:hypothetical protein
MLTNTPTNRGFARFEFTDGNAVSCSLQESSADGPFIWLGCNEIGLKIEIPGIGWRDVETKSEGPYGINYLANTRMHLTQEQVAALLPILQRFVETGELSQ